MTTLQPATRSHYGPDYDTHAPYSRACLFEVFEQFGLPETMADVGCGKGHLVEYAVSLGVDAMGLDGGVATDLNAHIYQVDLAYPVHIVPPREMVISWEVAEHIAPGRARCFADNLFHSTGTRLIFTAAVPGQGGYGHVNEQPHEYWRELFTARGMRYLEQDTKTLRNSWKSVAGPCWWYPQNVQVFSR